MQKIQQIGIKTDRISHSAKKNKTLAISNVFVQTYLLDTGVLFKDTLVRINVTRSTT